MSLWQVPTSTRPIELPDRLPEYEGWDSAACPVVVGKFRRMTPEQRAELGIKEITK